MGKLKWGKPAITIATLASNGTVGTFGTALANVKKDSTQLVTAEGTKIEALLEGNEVADVRFEKGEITISWVQLSDGVVTKPIADNDGIIAEEVSIRLTPEDAALPGFLIPRARGTMTTSFNAAGGEEWMYKFTALKPASGNSLQPYTPA